MLGAPATKAEAKARWPYTRSVLTDAARKAYKAGSCWTLTRDGYYVMVSKPDSQDYMYAMIFVKDGRGNVYGVDITTYVNTANTDWALRN